MASNSALIVATEASASAHGARLARALQERCGVEWFGIGGDAMRDAGVELVAHAREFSVLGIFEVIRHFPRLYGLARRVLAEAERRKPRLAVLIDSPGFNLHLARRLHGLDVPVVYFIAPQLWAWRPRRIRYLQRYVRKLICIFPFEEEYFGSRDVDTTYVGHPLVDAARAGLEPGEFFATHGFDPGRPLVTLMPGSRNQEVERHLPTLLASARELEARHRAQYCLIQPDTVSARLVENLLAQAPGLPVKVLREPPYNALAASTAAVISSGTATVEALLMQTPTVVVYRVTPASWLVGRWLIRTPFYSMVNLLAEREMAPELIQDAFSAGNLTRELDTLLSDTELRRRIQSEMGAVKQKLGEAGAIERAARVVESIWQDQLGNHNEI